MLPENNKHMVCPLLYEGVSIRRNGSKLRFLLMPLNFSGTAMKDLKLQSLKKGSSDHFANDTGLYNHTYTTDTTQFRGSYTFIWERTDDDSEWKVKAMNISDIGNYKE